MNDTGQRPGAAAQGDSDVDDPSGRRAATYEARTQTPLDLLALVTLWIVLVPPWEFGHDAEGLWWTVRIALSVVYGAWPSAASRPGALSGTHSAIRSTSLSLAAPG